MKITPQQFIDLLAKADAVSVDGGPLLSHWDTALITGENDNQVAAFSWEDADYSYWLNVTEEAIREGYFREDNTFVCSGDDPDDTEIRLFTLTPLHPH